MEELITTFHIDWTLMAAQFVNFVIVAFVLWKFAFKPLIATMTERSATIEKSLQDAAAIERRLATTEEDVKKQILEAKHQAVTMLEQSKRDADERKTQLMAKAKEDVAKVVEQARVQIQHEKETMLVDAKRELATLIIQGAKKVIGEAGAHLDDKVVKERVKKLPKKS